MIASWPPAPPAVVPRAALPPQAPPDRIKLLHVITRFAGGSGGNTLTSAMGMDPARYERWIAAAPGGMMWETAEAAGVHTVRLSRMRERIALLDDVQTLFDLVTLMRRERFTVVHTHCAKAGMLGRLAARIVGTPVVVHTFHALPVHDFMSRRRRALYLLLDRLARPLAHQYVAVAPRLARQAVQARIVRPGSITVVPSGVDMEQVPDRPAATTRAALGIPDAASVVGTVGRIVAQKAPLDFVRMAALVKRSRPDTVFVMVGDASQESAPLEKETKEEARRLGVDILFTGYRPDAAAIAAAFDVYVVPSIYEGLGRALTEAMVSGRPVVATSVNGVPDLVEPGATGLLAAPGDHPSLAACVVWLLDNPDAARRMGVQGRNRVLSMFDADTMCRALDSVYSGLLGLPEQAVESSSAAVTRLVPVPVVDVRRHGVPAASASGGPGATEAPAS